MIDGHSILKVGSVGTDVAGVIWTSLAHTSNLRAGALAILGTSVLLLSACGATVASDAEASVSSTTTTDRSTTTTVDEHAGERFVPVGKAPKDLDRESLRTLVAAQFQEGDEPATDAQVDCLTDHYVDEIGLERLDDMGVGIYGITDSPVISEALASREQVEAYVAPMFDCLDLRPTVVEDLDALDPTARDCVADKVLADRGVRVIFLLGTKKGHETSSDMERVTESYVAEYQQIVASCT